MDFPTPRRGVSLAERWATVPARGDMKNNVQIAVTLVCALALFFLVVHFFPLTGAGR